MRASGFLCRFDGVFEQLPEPAVFEIRKNSARRLLALLPLRPDRQKLGSIGCRGFKRHTLRLPVPGANENFLAKQGVEKFALPHAFREHVGLGIGHNRGVNVVLLVGRVSNRPYRPGDGERVFMQIEVASARRPGMSDEIELHCFGQTANSVEKVVHLGDMVEVRGRIEQRIGRDAEGEYEDLRIVADDVTLLRNVASKASASSSQAEETRPSCDGTSCADETFTEGVVKAFRPNQHFGFITVPNVEQDVFFGARDVHGRVPLQPGDRVRFVLQTRERGPGATHVSRID